MGFWGSSISRPELSGTDLKYSEKYYDRIKKEWFKDCCALCEELQINLNQIDDRDNQYRSGGVTKYRCDRKGRGTAWHLLGEHGNYCFREEKYTWYYRDFYEIYSRLADEIRRCRYFILTTICIVLNIDFSSDLYQKIKALIDSVREDMSTIKQSAVYDAFGPKLAEKLYTDPENVDMCKRLLENYLTEVYVLILQNKQEEAIQVYENMVKFLFIRYRNFEDYSNLINEESFENPKLLIRK